MFLPFESVLGNPLFIFNHSNGELSVTSRVFLLLPFSLFQEGLAPSSSMDLSKVGERILNSVISTTSRSQLLPLSDRPEIPARAAAAAAIARAIARLPPHQRYSLSTSSEELSSIYGRRPHDQVVEELEDGFYEEDFDPVRHVLEHLSANENEKIYFEKQAALRLTQLDRVAEHLSRHVMEHHEVMVKGMNLVRELERDLRIANVISMNGRRHLTSSVNEVSRDLIVNSYSKKKQALLDLLPILTELHRAFVMKSTLESLVEEGSYCKAFQVFSEYLQVLDSLSELSVIQEMSQGVEVWLGITLQKLDGLLLEICQEFKQDGYITVIDAYALMGDTTGLAEKIQSFFMQEVISETNSVLKFIVQEEEEFPSQNSRLTYSDLCLHIPESKFRQCLLRTLAILFEIMCSYHEIMDFQLERKDSVDQTSNTCNNDISSSPGEAQEVVSDVRASNNSVFSPGDVMCGSSYREESATVTSLAENNVNDGSPSSGSHDPVAEASRKEDNIESSIDSPWYHLRKDATAFVSQTLQRGCKNLWHLTTSRVSVLISSSAAASASIHQFLKNYEDLTVFILAGEAFCGIEAVEFRQKLKLVCENYFITFHKQNVHALKVVLEKDSWLKLPPDTVQLVSFAGLTGDGAPLISLTNTKSTNTSAIDLDKSVNFTHSRARKSGFSDWIRRGNPFLLTSSTPKEGHGYSQPNGMIHGDIIDGGSRNNFGGDKVQPKKNDSVQMKGDDSVSEDENEDLLADFIDEDSQLPSRISKLNLKRGYASHCNDDENTAHTGSSLCLLRCMDKYARLMQKIEVINVEFFKGICQSFEIFFHFIYETFGQLNSSSSGKSSPCSHNHRLKTALSRIKQDCDMWMMKPQSSPTSLGSPFVHAELTPTSPPGMNFGHSSGNSLGLTERCVAVDALSLVARTLNRSRAHLRSMLLQSNTTVLEDFYVHLVDAVPDLIEHVHRTTARLLLHVNGYIERIANSKWEVKELGLEHNGYVDLLLGEFKHYAARLAHGGIRKEIQDKLLDYGLEILAETLVEGLLRVKRCSDEGRALMSLDLQVNYFSDMFKVLINGLQHLLSLNVKSKLQMVETYIKAYYLPDKEYVQWAHAHPNSILCRYIVKARLLDWSTWSPL
nr:syndetin isoform X2 [Arachis hypogaea]